MLVELDGERVQLELDGALAGPDDLPGQRGRAAVPQHQRAPQALRQQLEVAPTLEPARRAQLAALGGQARHLGVGGFSQS